MSLLDTATCVCAFLSLAVTRVPTKWNPRGGGTCCAVVAKKLGRQPIAFMAVNAAEGVLVCCASSIQRRANPPSLDTSFGPADAWMDTMDLSPDPLKSCSAFSTTRPTGTRETSRKERALHTPPPPPLSLSLTRITAVQNHRQMSTGFGVIREHPLHNYVFKRNHVLFFETQPCGRI